MSALLLEAQQLQALSPEGKSLSPAVSFTLEKGDVLFLRGENGAGKSSLIRTLLGLHRKYTGKIRLHILQSEIQYLPQLGTLHFHIPICLQDLLPPGTSSPLLEGLNLQQAWNTASGGERQRVLFASALSKSPRLLILDEPFNHVDKDSTARLEQALGDYLQSHPESAVILVSHRPLTHVWPSLRILEVR